MTEVAVQLHWVRPTLEDSDRLVLEGSRHPVVERMLPGGEFVPNAVQLDGRSRQILLTPPPLHNSPPPAGFITPVMAFTRSVQRECSEASCFLPAAVSR